MRGHRISAPRDTATRPTTDRVREAIFSMLTARLGPDLGAGPVLDAFAGSGALGLEAFSRGAHPVTFVESDRRAVVVLKDNIKRLRAEHACTVRHADVFALVSTLSGSAFSLILLDPPYTLDPNRVRSLLAALAAASAVRPHAVVVWEHGARTDVSWPEGFVPLTSRRYGSTAIDIAEYTGERGPA